VLDHVTIASNGSVFFCGLGYDGCLFDGVVSLRFTIGMSVKAMVGRGAYGNVRYTLGVL
jgi:hypothetical protein